MLAGVLLYGIIRRIRSSRQLEYALGNNVDFLWLAEGRSIDHTTLAFFRTRFKTQLKDHYTAKQKPRMHSTSLHPEIATYSSGQNVSKPYNPGF